MSSTKTIRGIAAIAAVCGVLYGAWLLLLLTLPYLSFNANVDFLATKQRVYNILHWRASFYIHVFTGVFVLVSGLTQFSSYLLGRHKRLHRMFGYIYVTGVLCITGPAGLVMAFYANGGIPARISFVLLSVLWIATTLLALGAALRRRFVAHGSWMMRSYALTLSAITLRFYTYIIGSSGIDMDPVHEYIMVSWLSWTLNLLIAEWLIRGGAARRIMKDSALAKANQPQQHS